MISALEPWFLKIGITKEHFKKFGNVEYLKDKFINNVNIFTKSEISSLMKLNGIPSTPSEHFDSLWIFLLIDSSLMSQRLNSVALYETKVDGWVSLGISTVGIALGDTTCLFVNIVAARELKYKLKSLVSCLESVFCNSLS